MDGIYVAGSDWGPYDGADIVFFMHHKRIVVSFFPTHKPLGDKKEDEADQRESPLEDSLIRQISADAGDSDELLNDVLETVLEVGKSIFAEVAPLGKSVPQSAKRNLHNILYPQTFYYRLLTADGNPTIIPISADESYINHTPNFDYYEDELLEIDEDLPKYSTHKLSIEKSLLVSGGAHLVGRISVDGNEMLCKAWGTGDVSRNMEQEVSRLYRIRKASLQGHNLMHIPSLLGYVEHSEADCVIGLLREWIPGTPLKDISISTTPESKRQKWASQISSTVHQLHKLGLVWGDGKPHNIIIDEKEDAWLIDFGGGWTNKWVPEELADTPEGDEHALKKILEYLQCAAQDVEG
ncbi:hypothetical protein F5Y08DRAFT_323866 [Xylaria arbuscula]|nr:hypothetical protein F5Y08DRAFT_323866 [Xylaria arbuscula]